MTKFAKNLEFDQDAIEDLAYWVKKDRRKAEKILDLVQAIARDPFSGTGKPEPLKYSLAGCWSRRIDQEHRIVYAVKNENIRILSCLFNSHTINSILLNIHWFRMVSKRYVFSRF